MVAQTVSTKLTAIHNALPDLTLPIIINPPSTSEDITCFVANKEERHNFYKWFFARAFSVDNPQLLIKSLTYHVSKVCYLCPRRDKVENPTFKAMTDSIYYKQLRLHHKHCIYYLVSQMEKKTISFKNEQSLLKIMVTKRSTHSAIEIYIFAL